MPRVRNKKQRAESERMLVGCFTIPSISCWLICFFSAALVEPVSRRTWGLRRGPRGLQGKLSKTQSQAKSRSRRSVSWSSAVLRCDSTEQGLRRHQQLTAPCSGIVKGIGIFDPLLKRV
eukprot:3966930-Pyramimonas_sp.AAC.1